MEDIFLVLEDVSISDYFKNASPTGLESLATMQFTKQTLDYAHMRTETGHEFPLKILIVQFELPYYFYYRSESEWRCITILVGLSEYKGFLINLIHISYYYNATLCKRQ